ncbi:MAG: dTDP-4-dehydrorhamnose 3,5-epimerase [Xanthomonadales bacterium]|nr:dTDP-4-dehydrorhamnose 3,5-epimerase [Xanthomonadales bacterium]
MKFRPLELEGVVLVEPRVFGDERGFFLETFREDAYREALLDDQDSFVQDNHSRSRRGVLRGLHFQTRRPQGKLLRCVAGEIFDVAVDVRPGSPQFGQWVAVTLSADNKHQLYVPPGFAHGFQVVSETADVEYKCTDYYDPDGEGGIRWDDPRLAIPWPVADPVVSAKDQALPHLGNPDRP